MPSNIETDETQNIIKAGSYALFYYKDAINQAILNFFPQFAGDAYLEQIGRDRNAPRYAGEDLDEYRARVVDAFNFNRGIGKAEDIIRAMRSIGYSFNSFDPGDTSGGPGSFNLLVHSTGTAKYDGTYIHAGSIDFSAANENDIIIELVQVSTPSPGQVEAILEALAPVIRASSIILAVTNVSP
jgi:hypothetical protein